MNLLGDIAQNGLSIEPLVLSRNTEGKWVVRDGNRRVAALQLLNEPERCPDPELRRQIENMISRGERVLSYVNCFASDSEEAILRYLDLKHTGENQGIGQESWSALTKAIFNVSHGFPDQNKRAVQLLFWAEEQGIRFDDNFPVTNLNRMLNQNTLKLLGFTVENDNLALIIDAESARRIIERVMRDFAQRIKTVEDVFTPKQALEYVTAIRQEELPDMPVDAMTEDEHVNDPQNATVSQERTGKPQLTHPHPNNITTGDQGQVPSPSDRSPQGHRSFRKPSWERDCIFPRKKHGISVPTDNTKVRNIITELCDLKVRKTPIAVALLLRALIELSERRYREVQGLPHNNGLRQNIAAAARHMEEQSKITGDQKELIIRKTHQEGDILNVTTLQKYVHSPDFHPSYQVLNILWDEIGFFVQECWKS